MNIEITEESRRFIRNQVSNGRYASADDVVENALRRMREEEHPPRPAATLDNDPLWGMFREDPQLIDQIVQDAMRDRRSIPLRVSADEKGRSRHRHLSGVS
jgi:putative addiction module CopG family antidote